MAQPIDEIESIEEVIEEANEPGSEEEDVVQPMEALSTTTNKKQPVMSDEFSPVEERNFCTWFLSLQERKDVAMLLRYKDVKPETLPGKSGGALRELFCTTKVHLYLPWWDEKNTTKTPSDWYEIKYASNTRDGRMFAGDYNPLLVKREKAGAVVAVVYNGVLFRREKQLPMFLELLGELVADPNSFFDRMGKRWGHCLCCKREITAGKSLQHAIGPVCYKRLKTLDGWVKKAQEEIQPSGEDEVVATACLLNPVERKGITQLNALLKSYTASGMQFDEQCNLMLMPADTISQRLVTSNTAGDLVQKYIPTDERWKYKTTVGRARKDCNVFLVDKSTPHTIGVLQQLGGVYSEQFKAWLVTKEQTADLALHFRILKEVPTSTNAISATSTSTAANSTTQGEVLTPPPLSGKKKSTPKDRKIVVKALAGDIVEVTGDTYMHRGELRAAGASWDKDTRAWRGHIAIKPQLDAIAARVNND